jgi:tetratricopeptide (TPR) repeat protein
MGAQRCEKHELLIDQCSECRKRTQQAPTGDFTRHLNEIERAYRSASWQDLEIHSAEALKIATGSSRYSGKLEYLLKSYLAGLLGSGEFIFENESSRTSTIKKRVDSFQSWIEGEPLGKQFESHHKYLTYISEIVIYATSSESRERTRLAGHLRNLTRPDLAIAVCDELLKSNPENAVALTVKGAALCDEERLAEALKTLNLAVAKSSSISVQLLNTYSRAKRLRFTRTGNLKDCEDALALARQAWALQPDEYSRNTLVGAAYASRDSALIDEVERLVSGFPAANTPRDDPGAEKRAMDLLRLMTHG